MNSSLTSFVLTLLIEGIYAIVNYLTSRLMHHMQHRAPSSGFDTEPEFA